MLYFWFCDFSQKDPREIQGYQVCVVREPEQAMKHNIRAIPTVIAMEGGKEVRRYVGDRATKPLIDILEKSNECI